MSRNHIGMPHHRRSTVPKNHLGCSFLTVFLLMLAGPMNAQTNLRTAQASFDRCQSQMDRADRLIRRLETTVGDLQRDARSQESEDDASAQLLKLDSRVNYLLNRYERSRGQADKIRTDLKNVDGTTCPSCVQSSIDLYCRSADNLLTEVEESIDEARLFEASVAGSRDSEASVPEYSAVDTAAARVKQLRSLNADLAPELDSCTSASGKVLRKQARKNLAKADSLSSAGEAGSALKAADIAESLFRKAAVECEAE